MKEKIRLLLIILGLLLLAMALSGCKNESGSGENNQTPQPSTVEAVLYFGDAQAEYLLAEKRPIEIEEDAGAEALAISIVNELIAGPEDQELQPTIPPESKLLSLTIEEGVARVDFSEEISSQHPGGSAGESMTMYSLINTLTEIDGIDKVQLLIAGKETETLAGHWDTSQPLERNEDAIKK